jgi:DNA-binding MarR family transcriptional regulator
MIVSVMNMNKKHLNPLALSLLLEQVARGLHSLSHDGGLFPAQWAALRYFSTMQPEHCTAIGLARYQGLAYGPVNRTVRTLIEKGLLQKGGSLGKGRSTRVDLTRKGLLRLKRDPLQVLSAAIQHLSAQEQLTMAAGLEQILRALHVRHEDKGTAQDFHALLKPTGVTPRA